MSSSISFTAAGIDVSSIVSGLIAVDRQPVDRLKTRQAAVKLQSDAVGRLKTTFESMRTSAANLLSNGVTKFSSSVSNTSVVSATLSSTATAGSLSFSVDKLARAHGMRSAATVTDSTSVATTEASLAISTTSTKLGLGAASVGAGVTAGKYTVTVT